MVKVFLSFLILFFSHLVHAGSFSTYGNSIPGGTLLITYENGGIKISNGTPGNPVFALVSQSQVRETHGGITFLVDPYHFSSFWLLSDPVFTQNFTPSLSALNHFDANGEVFFPISLDPHNLGDEVYYVQAFDFLSSNARSNGLKLLFNQATDPSHQEALPIRTIPRSPGWWDYGTDQIITNHVLETLSFRVSVLNSAENSISIDFLENFANTPILFGAYSYRARKVLPNGTLESAPWKNILMGNSLNEDLLDSLDTGDYQIDWRINFIPLATGTTAWNTERYRFGSQNPTGAFVELDSIRLRGMTRLSDPPAPARVLKVFMAEDSTGDGGVSCSDYESTLSIPLHFSLPFNSFIEDPQCTGTPGCPNILLTGTNNEDCIDPHGATAGVAFLALEILAQQLDFEIELVNQNQFGAANGFWPYGSGSSAVHTVTEFLNTFPIFLGKLADTFLQHTRDPIPVMIDPNSFEPDLFIIGRQLNDGSRLYSPSEMLSDFNEIRTNVLAQWPGVHFLVRFPHLNIDRCGTDPYGNPKCSDPLQAFNHFKNLYDQNPRFHFHNSLDDMNALTPGITWSLHPNRFQIIN